MMRRNNFISRNLSAFSSQYAASVTRCKFCSILQIAFSPSTTVSDKLIAFQRKSCTSGTKISKVHRLLLTQLTEISFKETFCTALLQALRVFINRTLKANFHYFCIPEEEISLLFASVSSS